MKGLACLTLALIAAAPTLASAKGPARCNVHGAWSFPRKAALPRGAAAALGFAMAERGAPWNPTDVINSRRPSLRPLHLGAAAGLHAGDKLAGRHRPISAPPPSSNGTVVAG